MTIRRLFRFTPAILAVTAGFLLLSGCRGRHCGWSDSPEKKSRQLTGRIARELDLTGPQKARLDAIRKDILARKAEFASLHEGLRETAAGQLRADAVDADLLNRGLEEREAKARELRAFLVSKFAEFHALLEPAQREKLAARIESHRKRR